MNRWFLAIVFTGVFISRSISLAQEEVKGPFKLKDHLLQTPSESLVLRDDVKVLTLSGRPLSPESLPFARLIKVYKDVQGRVKEIVVLGWED